MYILCPDTSEHPLRTPVTPTMQASLPPRAPLSYSRHIQSHTPSLAYTPSPRSPVSLLGYRSMSMSGRSSSALFAPCPPLPIPVSFLDDPSGVRPAVLCPRRLLWRGFGSAGRPSIGREGCSGVSSGLLGPLEAASSRGDTSSAAGGIAMAGLSTGLGALPAPVGVGVSPLPRLRRRAAREAVGLLKLDVDWRGACSEVEEEGEGLRADGPFERRDPAIHKTTRRGSDC